MIPEGKEQLCTYIVDGLVKRLKIAALQSDKTLQEVVEEALLKAVEKLEKKK